MMELSLHYMFVGNARQMSDRVAVVTTSLFLRVPNRKRRWSVVDLDLVDHSTSLVPDPYVPEPVIFLKTMSGFNV
jgi:hypothetical protein